MVYVTFWLSRRNFEADLVYFEEYTAEQADWWWEHLWTVAVAYRAHWRAAPGADDAIRVHLSVCSCWPLFHGPGGHPFMGDPWLQGP